jgi:clan AA aspartic protease
MGHIYAKLELRNPRLPELNPVSVRALVDTGAMTLCIPEHVARQLALDVDSRREVMTADGSLHDIDYVGPIRISFENRSCFGGAMVIGNEVLLGAVPIEDMDLVIQPSRRRIVVNPDSPNIASAKVK